MNNFRTDFRRLFFMQYYRDICVAGVFLTILPFKIKGQIKDSELAEASWAFPLIGMTIGAISGGMFMLAYGSNLNPFFCAIICVFVSILVTGGLHEDGLADMADGFGGGSSRDEKLRIMRDSQVGTYGVIALIFTILMRTVLLDSVAEPKLILTAMILSGIMSRSLLPFITFCFREARPDGLAAKFSKASKRISFVSFVLGVIICSLFIGLTGTLFISTIAISSVLLTMLISYRQIGGYTGDTLGGCQQICEVAVLIAVTLFFNDV